MADDHTTFVEKPKADAQQVVETKVTSTSSHSGRQRREGQIGGMSGRFWITLVMALGLVGVVVANVITGKVPEPNLTAGFISTASLALGVYLGQNQQPKPPGTP